MDSITTLYATARQKIRPQPIERVKMENKKPGYPIFYSNVFRANSPREVRGLLSNLGKGSHGKIVYLEILSILLTIGIVLYVNWQWLFVGLIPSFLIGWILTDNHNYYEHYHARTPFSRFANSVSYYGRLYNKIWFNEGYHQEHHVHPQTHWSIRPSIRKKYRDDFRKAGLYVSKYPMHLGFLDRKGPIFKDSVQ